MTNPNETSSPKTSIYDSEPWKFLNSGFFLWFLSTVVIGAGSYFYTTWSETRQLRLQTSDSIRKLDLEIANRLSFFAEQILARVEVEDALLVIENPKKSSFPVGVFPEFYDRSLHALLWDLHSLVPVEEKDEIKTALNSAKDFKAVYLSTINYKDSLDELLLENSDELFSGNSENSVHQNMEPKAESGLLPSSSEETEAVAAIPDRPIEINMNLKIKHELEIRLEKEVMIIEFTFDAFNLERWGKPFQKLIVDVKETITTINETTSTK